VNDPESYPWPACPGGAETHEPTKFFDGLYIMGMLVG